MPFRRLEPAFRGCGSRKLQWAARAQQRVLEAARAARVGLRADHAVARIVQVDGSHRKLPGVDLACVPRRACAHVRAVVDLEHSFAR
eukprot:2983359-Prymnesium_polylepis.2